MESLQTIDANTFIDRRDHRTNNFASSYLIFLVGKIIAYRYPTQRGTKFFARLTDFPRIDCEIIVSWPTLAGSSKSSSSFEDRLKRVRAVSFGIT